MVGAGEGRGGTGRPRPRRAARHAGSGSGSAALGVRRAAWQPPARGERAAAVVALCRAGEGGWTDRRGRGWRWGWPAGNPRPRCGSSAPRCRPYGCREGGRPDAELSPSLTPFRSLAELSLDEFLAAGSESEPDDGSEEEEEVARPAKGAAGQRRESGKARQPLQAPPAAR